MPERKPLVGQEFGAPDAPQEQQFVARVDETVRFGEEGGRPGHQSRCQFGPGDQEVAEGAAQTTNNDESVDSLESEGWAITE